MFVCVYKQPSLSLPCLSWQDSPDASRESIAKVSVSDSQLFYLFTTLVRLEDFC